MRSMTRQRTPGSPDRIERAVFTIVQHFEVLESFLDEFLRLFERFAGDILERQPAKRQRHSSAHVRAVHVNKFERAAAKVADNAVRLMNSGHDAQRGEMSLALSGKHGDSCAANAFGLGNESAAVARIAAGRSGNRPDTPHMQDIAQSTKTAQRIECSIDCVGRQ